MKAASAASHDERQATRCRLSRLTVDGMGTRDPRRVLRARAPQLAALLLLERAGGRSSMAATASLDGAAPLIGSSAGIRLVRDRIERVAATDFTVLIEGASDLQPHSDFIEVFSQAAFD